MRQRESDTHVRPRGSSRPRLEEGHGERDSRACPEGGIALQLGQVCARCIVVVATGGALDEVG